LIGLNSKNGKYWPQLLGEGRVSLSGRRGFMVRSMIVEGEEDKTQGKE